VPHLGNLRVGRLVEGRLKGHVPGLFDESVHLKGLVRMDESFDLFARIVHDCWHRGIAWQNIRRVPTLHLAEVNIHVISFRHLLKCFHSVEIGGFPPSDLLL
jgi:hypothetical protein